jgi:mannitol-specific phosphotransferase system IIBC component
MFISLSVSFVFSPLFFTAEIADLRRKFEADKQKIEKMKAARKFNPL